MASQIKPHILIGQKGEQAAEAYLVKKGYTILHRNYRSKRAEIDIIASLGSNLIFVEVKTRASDVFGYPEEAVSKKKENMLLNAAEQYIIDNGWESEIRFDVIAVTLTTPVSIHHIEDAFH